MRCTRRLLVTLGIVAAAATGTAVAAPPVDTGYVWAQPGTAHIAAPHAQPQLPAVTVERPPLLTTYTWAQPGAALRDVPYAQPWQLN